MYLHVLARVKGFAASCWAPACVCSAEGSACIMMYVHSYVEVNQELRVGGLS